MLQRGREREVEQFTQERDRLIASFATARSPQALKAWADRQSRLHRPSRAQYVAWKARLRASLPDAFRSPGDPK